MYGQQTRKAVGAQQLPRRGGWAPASPGSTATAPAASGEGEEEEGEAEEEEEQQQQPPPLEL